MKDNKYYGEEGTAPSMQKIYGTGRISINISGEIYETRIKTLERFPETLLGNHTKRCLYYNKCSNELFFDRNRLFFDAILFYYQSYGILKCPQAISLELFEEECRFYEISEDAIFKLRARGVDMSYLCKKDSIEDLGSTSIRATLWNVIRYPETSLMAKVYVIFSMTVIFFSIAISCVETEFTHQPPNSVTKARDVKNKTWSAIELGFNCWFLFEVVLTFLCAPSKKDFFTSKMNIIDMIAVIPYFFVLMFAVKHVSNLGLLKILRILRVTRLFRLSRHSTRIKVVGEVMKNSFQELKTLFMIIVIVVVLQGGVMYYIEGFHEGTKFTSIPVSAYWSVVTATTVGYGDIYPTTTTGILVASVFMILGTLLLVTPVLNFADKFKAAYDSVTVPSWETELQPQAIT